MAILWAVDQKNKNMYFWGAFWRDREYKEDVLIHFSSTQTAAHHNKYVHLVLREYMGPQNKWQSTMIW